MRGQPETFIKILASRLPVHLLPTAVFGFLQTTTKDLEREEREREERERERERKRERTERDRKRERKRERRERRERSINFLALAFFSFPCLLAVNQRSVASCMLKKMVLPQCRPIIFKFESLRWFKPAKMVEKKQKLVLKKQKNWFF